MKQKSHTNPNPNIMKITVYFTPTEYTYKKGVLYISQSKEVIVLCTENSHTMLYGVILKDCKGRENTVITWINLDRMVEFKGKLTIEQ